MLPGGRATAATVASSIVPLRLGRGATSVLPSPCPRHHFCLAQLDQAGLGGCRRCLGMALATKRLPAERPAKDRAAARPEVDLRLADMFFLCIKRKTVTWMWCKTKAVP